MNVVALLWAWRSQVQICNGAAPKLSIRALEGGSDREPPGGPPTRMSNPRCYGRTPVRCLSSSCHTAHFHASSVLWALYLELPLALRHWGVACARVAVVLMHHKAVT